MLKKFALQILEYRICSKSETKIKATVDIKKGEQPYCTSDLSVSLACIVKPVEPNICESALL